MTILQYWDTRTNGQIASVALPERCYAMDVTSPVMVVGTAERHLLIYDLNNPNQPFKVRSICLLYFSD